jgi:pimeloyl-ACP methyl ester carboxylesterase
MDLQHYGRALAGLGRRPWSRRHIGSTARTLGISVVLGLPLLWAAVPAVRAVTLVGNWAGRGAPDAAQVGIPVHTVSFAALDGTRLSGWLALASPHAPTVILVHGFKGSRRDMLPWAHFLFAAGYNALLLDDRGCGQSEGWVSALGTREADDVVGAVRYLQRRRDLTVRTFGALGISLGAGIVLLAAAREPALAAVIADSAWTDERAQINHMATLRLGPLAVPMLPYEPALVDSLIGGRLEDTQPLAVIGQIAPRAILLIHSADDGNTTTPLAGERALYAAASQPKAQWIAPSGGHAGALHAHPAEYQALVLAFFSAHLGTATAP